MRELRPQSTPGSGILVGLAALTALAVGFSGDKTKPAKNTAASPAQDTPPYSYKSGPDQTSPLNELNVPPAASTVTAHRDQNS